MATMEINLFNTNIDELKEKLLGTVWQDRDGDNRTVVSVYLDRWHGAYCVRWNDGTWNMVEQVLKNGVQV